ncbi:unnamed protein product [Sphenostylis stenocarpa]|uniref:Uncharacterized protein n=1 Tax=Sphenostylis stenocarpa TaxID=92480 RepID=A0AA86VNJ7_9FABA|nr:unnamed protein product [Sphenostylis stenocarpa]
MNVLKSTIFKAPHVSKGDEDGPQPSQVSAVGANASQYAPVGNPNHNYQSQVAGHNGYGDQLVDPVQIPKVEQSMVHQVDPANANKVTPPLLRGTVPESSSARAHFANPFVNMNNQNAKPMLPSADQSKGLIPLQNQTQNLLMGRDLRREVSMEAAKNFKVGEGRAERSWDAGEGPSAKRLKHINSPPKEGPNQGPAPQEANNAPENPKLLDLINNTGNNGGFVSNSLYDPAFETLGLAVDPHIRLFEALAGFDKNLAVLDAARGEKGYRMFD